jgi:hypothetical protein
MEHHWGEWHEDDSSYHDHADGLGDTDGLSDPNLGAEGTHDPHGDLPPGGYGGLGEDHEPGLPDADDQPVGDVDHGHYADAGYPEDDPMGGHYPDEPVGYGEPGGHEGWDYPVDTADLAHETLVGADPDLGGYPFDSGWEVPDFPEPLDISLPEPVDGLPWSDPALLGDASDGGFDDGGLTDPSGNDGYDSGPPVTDLLDYAGLDSDSPDPWAALFGSDDPATSTLARWWAPGS